MTSVIKEEKIKTKSRNRQRSNSDSATIARETGTAQNFKIQQDNNNKYVEGEGAKGTRAKRRPSRVGLNDMLRRIRHLIVEGCNNMEIQSTLQLNERTFYRYMVKIYQIDQALFLKQEEKTMASELSVFRDRLLKTYRWFMTMADNEKIDPRIRMEAQRNAIEVAWALTILKFEGPRIIQKPELLDNLYHNSAYHRLKKSEARKSSPQSSIAQNEDQEQASQRMPQEQEEERKR
jgi:DNA-binding CsgD family transcriptional regulator